jgi:hypothetical protein
VAILVQQQITLSALALNPRTREIMKPFDTTLDTERGYSRVHESTQGEFLCLLLKIETDLTPIRGTGSFLFPKRDI